MVAVRYGYALFPGVMADWMLLVWTAVQEGMYLGMFWNLGSAQGCLQHLHLLFYEPI